MLFVACVALGVIAIVVSYYIRRAKAPPGPLGLPIIGNGLSLELIRKERSYMKLWKQYGPIFSVSDLLLDQVVLCDADLIREAFSKIETADRMNFKSLDDLTYTDRGILFSSGARWQHARRFTLHHLRNFGMGRPQMEVVIHTQISQLMDEILTPSVGKPINVEESLKIAIANIIWGILSSEEFGIHDTRALSVMRSFELVSEHMFTFMMFGLFPRIRKLPKKWTGESAIDELMAKPIDGLFRPAIAHHRETIDMKAEPRDYIDALLLEEARDPAMCDERHMQRCLLDLFFAGFDSTGSTLLWAFIFLVKHPDVQDKLRHELQQTLGPQRPSLADKPKLPYTEAFIMEVQRLANMAPYAIEHRTNETIELRGYKIPKDTILVSLLQAVHMDPANFDQPEQFRPERFLDEAGKVKPNKALMPFGVGKRSCLGEAMARAELFLFITCIVMKYRLKFPEGFDHDLSVSETKMVLREPTPFQLVLEEIIAN